MKPEAYDPFSSPLELPATAVDIRCITDQPFLLPFRPGHTPSTLLQGLWQLVLLATECRHAPLRDCHDEERLEEQLRRLGEPNGPGLSPCAGKPFVCREPETCPCAQLLGMRLSWQPGRTLPPVVKLAAPELWRPEKRREFTMRVTLLGRRTHELGEAVWRSLYRMGRAGLKAGRDKRTFQLGSPETVYQGALHGIVPLNGSGRVLLEILTPLLLAETAPVEGKLRRLFQAGGEVDVARLLGNLAYDLASLDLEDRADSLPVERRREAADQARRAVTAAAGTVRVERSRLEPADYGARESKTQSGRYPLRGFRGHLALAGVPAALYPYLGAMSLWRAGQSASKGFGEMRLWTAPGI